MSEEISEKNNQTIKKGKTEKENRKETKKDEGRSE
jgi:hypothetical protein